MFMRFCGPLLVALPLFLAAHVVANADDGIGSKARLEAQWKALNLTKKVVQSGPKPSDWSGGIFVGANAFNQALDQLEGYTIEYVGPDTEYLFGSKVVLQSLDLTFNAGNIDAELDLEATKGKLALSLHAAGNVSFQGIQDVDGKPFARFRLEPVEIRPAARIGFFKFSLKRFWGRLGPSVAVALADPAVFEVKIPLTDRISYDLEIKTQGTTVVNKDTGATVSYTASMPASRIEQGVTYAGPVITSKGVWVLARLSETGQIPLSADVPPSENLEQAVAKLRAEVEKETQPFSNPAEDVGILVGNTVLAKMGEKLQALPSESRYVTIQTTSHSGRLADKKWKDDVLGDGGVYAELAGRAEAGIQIGVPTFDLASEDRSFALPVSAKVSAPIHVHVDPLIGGGAGTTIGFIGSGSGKLSATLTPKVLQVAGENSVAAMGVVLSCDALVAQAKTDGKLKADFGWISVPSIGGLFETPLGRTQIGALKLLDSSPTFVEAFVYDPRREKDEAKRSKMISTNPWAVIPPAAAVIVRANPSSLNWDERALFASASFEFDQLILDGSPEALAAARAKVVAEAEAIASASADALMKQMPAAECPGSTKISVILGDVVIGENNEIVKWARNAWNDITKGPGPNHELRKLVDNAAKAAEKAADDILPDITIGKGHGGLGVQVGGWKF
ncbi:hypothetical protein [Sinorhizobium meliloti]|uniref:hypothetical protein n=1 Tax=Rhizobium meliloti TaxID=382 RepID=UPI000FD9B6BA|nr:hypothetical protein [Sinorhizobium meliloti]MDW9766672.1 hypothetical protein [Sinorhizobium meliloti]MDW9989259.1 hypothetical protein [Sinorhizobium meliloti]MDX0243558.1 hypothetical protein [Sinorhizobium meliloti]MDX0399605.1 hypothetical protein [Sinorhizobium meliloti]RVP10706.1 hypothetical protein CN083_03930 [Sinorhizobium meliloti]